MKRVSVIQSIGSRILETAPPRRFESVSRSALIWIDLEMTGYNPNFDHVILEVCCFITNADLDIIGEGMSLVIHHSEDVLDSLDDEFKQRHAQSGLLEKCRQSSLTVQDAEEILLTYLKRYTSKGVCPLAGNSVYMDKLFLMKYMPQVNNHVHYKIVDVSTLKQLCRRWSPEVYARIPPRRQTVNRSLDVIYESIYELRFYKKYFCKVDL